MVLPHPQRRGDEVKRSMLFYLVKCLSSFMKNKNYICLRTLLRAPHTTPQNSRHLLPSIIQLPKVQTLQNFRACIGIGIYSEFEPLALDSELVRYCLPYNNSIIKV